jgi:PadR family transcriptional regulator, regulatory protein PadR
MAKNDFTEEGYPPLSESTFYILISLAPGKKHGYAILKDVTALSEGSVTLSISTLYTALGRLLDQGVIERVDSDPDESPQHKPRKEYILTEHGRQVLAADTQRMKSLLRVAHLRLGEGVLLEQWEKTVHSTGVKA